MARCQSGAKPLSKPMMSQFSDAYVTKPKRVICISEACGSSATGLTPMGITYSKGVYLSGGKYWHYYTGVPSSSQAIDFTTGYQQRLLDGIPYSYPGSSCWIKKIVYFNLPHFFPSEKRPGVKMGGAMFVVAECHRGCLRGRVSGWVHCHCCVGLTPTLTVDPQLDPLTSHLNGWIKK